MKEVSLTDGRVCRVDDEDYDTIAQYRWGSCGGKHAVTKIFGILVYMHRMVMHEPAGRVDHEDLDQLNNQKANLRNASRLENARNRLRRKDSTMKFKGIHEVYGRYTAEIVADRKRYYLGSFARPEDAALAYDEAAIRLHGEFASTNAKLGLFISEARGSMLPTVQAEELPA